MTVVVGFVGHDGAVMASDTEGTEGGHTRIDVEKCWLCGGLLLGYSGNSAMKQPLEVAWATAITRHFGDNTVIPRFEAAEALTQAARPVMRHIYDRFVASRPGETAMDALGGALLAIGRDSDGYYLLELDHNNGATMYTSKGFHAVGSGGPAAYVAQGVLKGYDLSGRGVPHLRLAAFRTVQTCIDVLGGRMGVGGRVDLWYSERHAPFEKASTEMMEQFEEGLAKWTTLERESLDQVVLPEEAPEERAAEEAERHAEIPEELEGDREEAPPAERALRRDDRSAASEVDKGV